MPFGRTAAGSNCLSQPDFLHPLFVFFPDEEGDPESPFLVRPDDCAGLMRKGLGMEKK